MNKALRKAVIAGNWKMNKTPTETTALIEEIKPLVKDAGCSVIVCTPYTNLPAAELERFRLRAPSIMGRRIHRSGHCISSSSGSPRVSFPKSR